MSPTPDDVIVETRLFLQRAMPHLRDTLATLPIDANLWKCADSLLILDLLNYLEARFKVALAPWDLVPDHLGTLARIGNLIVERSHAAEKAR